MFVTKASHEAIVDGWKANAEGWKAIAQDYKQMVVDLQKMLARVGVSADDRLGAFDPADQPLPVDKADKMYLQLSKKPKDGAA